MKKYLMEKKALLPFLEQLTEAEKHSLAILEMEVEPKTYTVENGNAIIPVEGPLTRSCGICSLFFGGSTYDEIGEMTLKAEQDESVEQIHYLINSPGGEVDGVDTLGQIIKSVTKPTASFVDNMATSAAYWLASQTDKIIATSPAAEFGSIGVIVAGWDLGGILEKEGAKRILIASTDAPEKKTSYQLDTKEGEAAMVERLDDLHEIFAGRVADGRNTTIDNVNKNFGRGGVLGAREALKMGMIDKIENFISFSLHNSANSVSNRTNGLKNTLSDNTHELKNTQERTKKMENQENQEKQEINLDAEIVKEKIFEKGKEAGVDAERKRIAALMLWREKGEECAAIVDKAIKEGSSYNDVMSQLHAAATIAKDEPEPPEINANAETTLDGNEEKTTKNKLFDMAKEIGQEMRGQHG